MEITIKSDDVTIIIDKPDLLTWTESVELFVQGLRGCGFFVHNFSYADGDVITGEDNSEFRDYE